MPSEICVGGPKTERKPYKQTEPKISHGRSGRQVVYRFWPKTQLLKVYITIKCTQTGIQESQYFELKHTILTRNYLVMKQVLGFFQQLSIY